MKVCWRHCERFTFLALASLLLAAVSCTQSSKPRSITYKTLSELNEQNQVATCVIKRMPPGRTSIKGRLKEIDPQSKSPVEYEVEDDLTDEMVGNLVNRLRDKGVEVTFAASSQSGLSTFLPLGFILIAFLGFCFWLWMLIECALKEPSVGNDKVVWVLIILLTNVLGGVLYFIFRRPKRKRESRNNVGNP